MEPNIVARLQKHLLANPVGHDVVDRPIRPLPPCTCQAIEMAERDLGFRIPQVLSGIYTQVANGGFGPGYGVMGVAGGYTDDLKHNIVEAYLGYAKPYPEDPTWNWPRGWVPICHWGCIIYSVVDFLNEPHAVYVADISAKEPGELMESIFHVHKASFVQWLDDWMAGKDLWKEMRG